jgi:hypothetical protein
VQNNCADSIHEVLSCSLHVVPKCSCFFVTWLAFLSFVWHSHPNMHFQGNAKASMHSPFVHGLESHLKKGVGFFKLSRAAAIHNKNIVSVHNGVEAVCDGEHRAVRKLVADDALDEGVLPKARV